MKSIGNDGTGPISFAPSWVCADIPHKAVRNSVGLKSWTNLRCGKAGLLTAALSIAKTPFGANAGGGEVGRAREVGVYRCARVARTAPVRGAPQPSLAVTIRWIKSPTWRPKRGRPSRPCRERRVQHRRKAQRCQPTTVSVFTTTRTSRQGGPEPGEGDPEEPAKMRQARASTSMLEDRELLPKSKVLKDEITSAAESRRRAPRRLRKMAAIT